MAKYSSKKRSNKAQNTPQSPVKAKKHLGQHFLTDESVAEDIAKTLTYHNYKNVIEIGPGTGVLTKYIIGKPIDLIALDLDSESINYLNTNFQLEFATKIADTKSFRIIEANFLKENLATLFNGEAFAITGNFPYNISSQIVFKTIENKYLVPEFTGMFQKEVAQRICAKEGSKTYGVISVLTQAFYDAEYLFTVGPHVFNPPPKVDSGVLRLTRKENYKELPCSEKMLFTVVKTAFNQRRKTLRNGLKSLNLPNEFTSSDLFSKRPEQLSVTDFINLTTEVERYLS